MQKKEKLSLVVLWPSHHNRSNPLFNHTSQSHHLPVLLRVASFPCQSIQFYFHSHSLQPRHFPLDLVVVTAHPFHNPRNHGALHSDHRGMQWRSDGQGDIVQPGCR
ncbi:hypothetical protein BCR44DRAFT_380217 [Catenaria anguillulae PL171]|uniref:Uncharacterized protein n=1 Tax=Catenaria anguillulae PL171 TaxID=765915 RepID=A0A1Y2HKG2_9FUNG|nr:hypothetical protein BCR44DRAFT_380217 [Catenaria anguillulae PL171]